MNDPDNFLNRWSRRKRDAAEAQPEQSGGDETSAAPKAEGNTSEGATASPPARPTVAEFDVANLPPIESIDAGTDISAFMKPGVPSALRHAALRRAWSADPAIRDFMGPTENYWDGVGPEGIPGFGPLDPALDVKRMVSELFGEVVPPSGERDSSALPSVSAPPAESGGQHEGDKLAEPVSAAASEETVSQRTENGATQNHSLKDTSEPNQKIIRRHGGAMPE